MLERLRPLIGKKRTVLVIGVLAFVLGFVTSQFWLNGLPVLVNLGWGVLGGVLATLILQWVTRVMGDETFEIKTVGTTVFVNGVVPATSTNIAFLHQFQQQFLVEKHKALPPPGGDD